MRVRRWPATCCAAVHRWRSWRRAESPLASPESRRTACLRWQFRIRIARRRRRMFLPANRCVSSSSGALAAAALSGDRRECAGPGGGLPSTRRNSLGYRACGLPATLNDDGGSAAATRLRVQPVDGRIAHCPAAPADVALAHRLELRPPDGRRKGAAGQAVGLLRRVDTGGRGGRMYRRRHRPGTDPRSPDHALRQEPGDSGRECRYHALPPAGDRAAVCAATIGRTRRGIAVARKALCLRPGVGEAGGTSPHRPRPNGVARTPGNGTRQPARRVGVVHPRRRKRGRRTGALRRDWTVLVDTRPSHRRTEMADGTAGLDAAPAGVKGACAGTEGGCHAELDAGRPVRGPYADRA